MSDPARSAAERYQKHINDGDADSLVALFADSAVLEHPVGRFEGHEAIRGFYTTYVLPFSTHIDITSWVCEGPHCVFEMEARSPRSDKVSHAIDHVTVDEAGLITRIAIYYRASS